MKPTNHKENRRDRRLAENQMGKRRAVVVMRERNGKSLPFVFNAEYHSLDTIKAHVEVGTKVYADESEMVGQPFRRLTDAPAPIRGVSASR